MFILLHIRKARADHYTSPVCGVLLALGADTRKPNSGVAFMAIRGVSDLNGAAGGATFAATLGRDSL
jgi:hypothetical protein